MRCRNGFLISGLLLLALCSFRFESDTFKEFSYQASKAIPFDFSLLGPELVLIVKDGGVKIANSDVWYLVPKENRKVISIEPDIEAACMYYLKVDIDKADNVRTILSRLKKDEQNVQSEVELQKFESDSFFQLSVLGGGKMYLTEEGKINKVHYIEKEKLHTLYETKEPINAFCLVNSRSFLVAHKEHIALYDSKNKMRIIYSTPDKASIDGMTVNHKGEIYYSTKEGIWKITGEIEKKLFYEKIIPKLHGELKFLNPYLFIHIPSINSVVRIKVENL